MASAACAQGHLHNGTTRGRESELYGVKVYITDPPGVAAEAPPQAIVVQISDAYGWEFINLRLLADNYAERIGVRCILPDLLGDRNIDQSMFPAVSTAVDPAVPFLSKVGASVSAFSRLIPFLYRNRQAVAQPHVLGFFTALRKDQASAPLGVAGYCWGGQWAIQLGDGLTHEANPRQDSEKARLHSPLVDAVYTAHASHVVIPTDIENLRVPTCMSAGTADVVVSMAQVAQIKEVMTAKNDLEKAQDKFVIQTVEGATHGFAVRGNHEDPKQVQMAKDAEDHCVAHFKKWLVKA